MVLLAGGNRMKIEDYELRSLRQRALEMAFDHCKAFGGEPLVQAKAFENYMLGIGDVPQPTLKAA
jgi:hypothetical protein